MDFRFTSTDDGAGNLTLGMSGRLDTLSAATLADDIRDITSRPFTSLKVDLSALDYISSSGLRCLVDLYKASLGAGAPLSITGTRPSVREIFDITGFTRLFGID